jgi:hypothetical protein
MLREVGLVVVRGNCEMRYAGRDFLDTSGGYTFHATSYSAASLHHRDHV